MLKRIWTDRGGSKVFTHYGRASVTVTIPGEKLDVVAHARADSLGRLRPQKIRSCLEGG